jgi:addiction module HigA family antidote
MAIRIAPAFALHPGDWLRTEILEPHRLSVTDAARHLGVTRQAMSNLLNARAGLSADMAIRFEKAFGVKADTLLRMQTSYELTLARAHEGEIRVDRFGKAA